MAKTVLIVEDNELNMKLFHDLLEAHGYQTVGHPQRLRGARSRPQASPRPDPDGYPAAARCPASKSPSGSRTIRSCSAIPVVAVTAFAMKGDEERIREGGCEAYLSKPISVGKFIETVRHFLGYGVSFDDRAYPRRRRRPGQRQAAGSAAVGRIFRRADRHATAPRRWRSASAPNATSSCST